jgi:hypothetical protein
MKGRTADVEMSAAAADVDGSGELQQGQSASVDASLTHSLLASKPPNAVIRQGEAGAYALYRSGVPFKSRKFGQHP